MPDHCPWLVQAAILMARCNFMISAKYTVPSRVLYKFVLMNTPHIANYSKEVRFGKRFSLGS